MANTDQSKFIITDYFVGNLAQKDPMHTFNMEAGQIYLGSKGPEDYSRPPPPTAERKFIPPPPRFVGEFRNFYWNEYDFIGTSNLPNKYETDMLTPRAILPTFPQWPREPTYSITCKPKLEYALMNRVVDVKQGGDMWLIEFKTKYEGVLYTVSTLLSFRRLRLHIFGWIVVVRISAVGFELIELIRQRHN